MNIEKLNERLLDIYNEDCSVNLPRAYDMLLEMETYKTSSDFFEVENYGIFLTCYRFINTVINSQPHIMINNWLQSVDSTTIENNKVEQTICYCVEYEHGFVKIGVTTDINRRLKELSAFSPLKITNHSFRQFPENSAYDIEAKLHKYFSYCNVHNEFFRCSLLDVDRELENMWARFEAHARGQTMRRINENKEVDQ